jgi:single-strand DNA-binding protein
MNKLTIIGNLTKDPELRTTQSGVNVCSFTVAVNRKNTNPDGSHDADFFRVTAWRELGENCAKWLIKGRKVAVVGPVSISNYTGQDGKTYANLEVMAQDVEFLTPRDQTAQEAPKAAPQHGGFTQVDTDELPF